MPNPAANPLDPATVAEALCDKLKQLAASTGWDGVQVSTGKKNDPPATIRIAYLSHQGNIPLKSGAAQLYLEWLNAGNIGTVIKWAKETGRRIGS